MSCGIENYNEDNFDEMWNINTKAPIDLTHSSWEHLRILCVKQVGSMGSALVLFAMVGLIRI